MTTLHPAQTARRIPARLAARPFGRSFRSVSSLFATFAALSASAQVAAPAAAPEKPTVVARVETVKPMDKDVVELSPFSVNAEKDRGFMAANAGTATRLSLDMKDVPAPYSVMTRDFIDALGLTNVQQATQWAVNGGNVPDGNGADTFGISTIAQVRGVILANGGGSGGSATTRNNYLSNGIQDSYNLERYEFGRGPNAALFSIGANSPLGGSMGATTKTARLDRSFETIETKFGSWDYKRATLDVNRPLTDKLAARANFVWMDRNGWKDREFEAAKGGTLDLAYLLGPKTQLRVEVANERFDRTIPQIVWSENVSGWNGAYTAYGPLTNAMFSTTATPGAANAFGQTLTLSGTTQGVDRRAGGYYVWVPGQGMIMNFQNEAITRRADDTATTPMLANGVLYTRGTGLPFGNAANQTQTPTTTTIGGSLNFLYQLGLAPDRFNRAIDGSRFRLPSKTENNSVDMPTFTQRYKDFNTQLTHQIGDRWFIEIGADGNQSNDRRLNMGPFQDVRIDLNQLLPNGANNPHFLTPYMDNINEVRYVKIDNRSFRYNLAYRANFGNWGEYVFNFNGSLTTRDTEQRFYQQSLKRGSDARQWLGNDSLVRIREYWYENARPYGTGVDVPDTVFLRDFASDNNSWTTSTLNVKPSWVLSSWQSDINRYFNNGLAMSAKYFDGKLVVLAAGRMDSAMTDPKRSVISKDRGYLPADWDGVTPLWLPTAPADFSTLTFLPRDASGNPTSTIANAASTRPTIATATPAGFTQNVGNIGNPIYANDRFRNDYSPPKNTKHPTSYSVGSVYNPKPWMAVVANYATSYQLPPVGRLALDGSLADVQVGSGYDLGLRFNLFRGQLQVNTGYYFNKQTHTQQTPPTTSPINTLYGANAYNDPLVGSRNNLGFADIIGTDYGSQKNNGFEVEIIGSFRNGLRLTFNIGSGQLLAYDRFPLSKVYVKQNADNFRAVLEAAGGKLDTTLIPTLAPHAPGTAILDPARPNSGAGQPADQVNAVNAYNNIWLQYEAMLNDKPVTGVRKITSDAYADYSFQTGRLKGFRVGAGVQYRGPNISGYRTADTSATVKDANGNPAVLYGPTDGTQYVIYADQALGTVLTMGYTMKLKNAGRFTGKEITYQLNVDNPFNFQKVVYQDDTVVPRAPNGDLSQPYRVSVPAKNATYQQPISAIFTVRLKL